MDEKVCIKITRDNQASQRHTELCKKAVNYRAANHIEVKKESTTVQ